ncbi:hypothetical protein [Bacillus sp. Marseille-P3800]|uniref:hypothetical protein n=1 Tax=Bacillus sp. Marseille-P3800 TaxID=2014782 RepID=UPI000C07D0A1|nr:hypothetical protein [Bacillus sp. Marseille-P3800]
MDKLQHSDHLMDSINESADIAILKAEEWLAKNKVSEEVKYLYYSDIHDYKSEQANTMNAYKELKNYPLDIEKLERKLEAFLKITDLKYVLLKDYNLTFTEDRIYILGNWISELYIRLISDCFETVRVDMAATPQY